MPIGLLMPLSGQSEQNERLRAQIKLVHSLKKKPMATNHSSENKQSSCSAKRKKHCHTKYAALGKTSYKWRYS